MAKYRYTAVDSQQRPVSGHLDAAGTEQALQQLTSRGLRATADDLTEVPESAAVAGRLTAEEAGELGGRLADLANSRLPLGPGFRAMAAELPRGRLGSVLLDMADRLDAGATLEAAMDEQGKRLPGHVRGLVLAGLRSGRLGEAMQQFTLIQHNRQELVGRVKSALAYPAILISLLVGLFVLFGTTIVPQFKKIFDDFGFKLPALTEYVICLASPWAWPLVAGLAALSAALWFSATVASPVWLRRVFYWFPILGPMWYWTRLAEFARLMQLLLGQQVPLPSALALTAEGMEDPSLAAGCHRLAADVEAGCLLSESLARRSPFPASLVPLVRWGERIQTLGEAFGAAVELFERRALTYASLLETVLPPLMFLFVLISVGTILLALFLPLINLISHLSGGS